MDARAVPEMPSQRRSASGLKATASTASRAPSSASARVALGPSWMPAPVSSAKTERSRSVALMPLRESAMAVVRPPTPPPTTSTRACGRNVVMRGRSSLRCAGRGGRHEHAGLRIALGGFKGWIVVVQRRAIRTDQIRPIAHIEINVRMVEGRRGAHALEFLDADLDAVDAFVVYEMRHQRLSHGNRDIWR